MTDPARSAEASGNPGPSPKPGPDIASQEQPEATAAAAGEGADAGPDAAQTDGLSTSGGSAGTFFGTAFRRLSLVSGLAGGLTAGAVGFLAAISLPHLTGQASKAAQALSGAEAVAANVAGLRGQLAEIWGLMQQPSGLEGGIAALEGRVGALGAEIGALRTATADGASDTGARLAALSRRVEALEKSGGDASLSQAAETEERLARFRARLDQFVADAEARIADVEARALKAGASASDAGDRFAVARLRAAVETGAPYLDVISTMEEVPAELADHASAGTPTLLALKQEFPDAARTSLAASRSVSGDGTVKDRIVAFLRKATNARSLTPQEGDGADAILSRAEARLSEGDLAGALAELGALPDASRPAMADWIARAELRLAVLGAIDALAYGMN